MVRLVFWVLFVYIFIFQPPVVPKLAYLGFQLLLFFFIGLLFRERLFRFLLMFKWELILVFVILMITCFRDGVTGEIVYFDRFLGWLFQAFLMSSVLVVLYESSHTASRSRIDFLHIIYFSIVLASLLTAALYFVPELDDLYRSIQLDTYYDRYEEFEKRYRAYGVSENLTFTYSFVLGLAAGYTLILAKSNPFYLISLPFLIFGVAVNARIGFVSFFFVFIYILFFGGLRQKAWILIVSCFSVISIFILGWDFIIEHQWSFGFFLSVADLFVHGLDGDNIFANLISSHVIIPADVIEFVFGSGISVYTDSVRGHSDIGYIIQLNYAGFVFVVYLLFVVFYMTIRLFKVLGLSHWYSWFFPLSMLVMNFKGFIFAMTPGGRLLILLYLFFVFKEARSREWIFGRRCFLAAEYRSS